MIEIVVALICVALAIVDLKQIYDDFTKSDKIVKKWAFAILPIAVVLDLFLRFVIFA